MRNILIVGILCGLIGCTNSQPNKTTGMGAMAGGAFGAGLGAIIGSTTGDAGAGLAVGALAGSAGGALIGNAFQAQDEKIEAQNELLQRQERTLSQQRNEIDELRGLSSDRTMIKRNKIKTGSDSSNINPIAKKTLSETTSSIPTSSTKTVASLPPASGKTSNCQEAAEELSASNAEKDYSTKLFHLRRALRLCPDNANYHLELARVYRHMGRDEDSHFEINEALRIDPDNSLALAMSR